MNHGVLPEEDYTQKAQERLTEQSQSAGDNKQ